MPWWICVLAALLVQQPAAPAPARAAAAPAASPFDYEFFKTRVQPIFLKKRPGNARCIVCHENGTPRLQALSPGETTWNDEQSRRNFEAWQRVVVPGDPLASRMLMHPLAAAAGGDPFHAGGKHWTSQDDPEWQTLAEWVRNAAPRAAQTATAAATGLDYAVYRSRIEPVFLKARRPDEGAGAACASCHTRIATRLRLQPLAAGATAWTEEQSRQNFDVVSRLVVPGDPAKSPLLLHPLAVAAGGDATHTGGKFWPSRDNPEWQMVAAWVSAASPAAGGGGAATAAATAVTLDFDFFRERVQPIFLRKRPGNARCIVCHENGTPRLQSLTPGATTWDADQSRKNFEAWQRVVVPGDPAASRMLMHPLAADAGGDPFHAGGKHWTSRDDPEWQTLAAWVRGARTDAGSR
jgi:hypothetical protein